VLLSLNGLGKVDKTIGYTCLTCLDEESILTINWVWLKSFDLGIV
jgi:hypothetical protein